MANKVTTQEFPMLEVQDVEYLEKVKKFAKLMGLEQQLQNKLNYLDTYGHQGTEPPPAEEDHYYKVTLYKDFAPNSFYIVWENNKTGKVVMQGGLIYHGPPSPLPEESNTRVQNWSVALDSKIGWRVHT